MTSGEETPKSESCDSEESSTPKKHERCEPSRRKKLRGEEEGYSKKKVTLFTQKHEIKLLKELLKFREQFGKINRWRAFHRTSELRHDFSDKQIAEKMRRLKEKFEKNTKSSPPDDDPREIRIFELSKSLWDATTAAAATRRGRKRVSADVGPSPQPQPKRRAAVAALANPQDYPRLTEFFSDVKVPVILRSHWGLMGSDAAQEFEKRWGKLYVEELSLCHEKLALKRELCLMLSEIIHRDVLAVQPSSSREEEHA